MAALAACVLLLAGAAHAPAIEDLFRAAARTETARRLQAAMRECVTRGTARSVTAKQAGAAWQLGGKTGTGPATAKPHDGWFAGLVFQKDQPKYAVAIYVDGGGPGGGVAASIAAGIASLLTEAGPNPRPRKKIIFFGPPRRPCLGCWYLAPVHLFIC